MIALTLVLQTFLFWFAGGATPQQNRLAPPRVNARSPHGPLAIPCDNCHTLSSWKPIRPIPEFDHNRTAFPLRGMHTGVACAQCHASPIFSNAGTTCATCHADIHRGQFGGRCEQCHTEKGWTVSIQSIQNHQNRFPLVGAHAVAECEACHTGAATSQFSGLSTDCLSCHIRDFQSAKAPNHQVLNFPSSCQSCHSMNSWAGAQFDHLKFTGFALTGAHTSLDCATCHVGGRFQGTPANCYGCHSTDYHTTANPNHAQAGFPTDCQTCHSDATWSGAKFDHNAFTSFPLNGAHASVACSSCHVNGQFAGTPSTCIGCHQQNYNGTTNPNHAQAGFPTDCTTCHSTITWAGAAFNHGTTAFPLTGAHVNVACNTCHVNSQFAGLSTTCVSCHLTDFNGTTSPSHVAAGFPQQCNICHNTSAWQSATFDHSTTAFPLTGAHVNVACASCHLNGNFTSTPTDCYSCHKTEYQNTTDPNHTAAGFATTCQTCHTTTQWTGATFNHTNFPIYSGTHAGLWTTCADCHVNQSNYAVFSCITCHAHAQSSTDPHHSGVGNYVYNATSCYSCHPQGRAN